MTVHGIGGRPLVDLEPYLDLGALAAIDDEVCLALTQVEVDYTGGSHKAMGIVPPSLVDEPYRDYGQVIQAFSDDEYRTFLSLADDPEAYDVDRRDEYEWGEERSEPLNRRQMLWLKYRHGVYFPWQVFYELIPTRYWGEKSGGHGKSFTQAARVYFPKTVAFVKSLPFARIGRCNILGLEANHHGTVHRDGVPEEKPEVDHFITICPRGDKRLYLWDEDRRAKIFVTARAYWFNDSDYHGVEADPFFRYSIRVDGVFRDDFLERLRREGAA